MQHATNKIQELRNSIHAFYGLLKQMNVERKIMLVKKKRKPKRKQTDIGELPPSVNTRKFTNKLNK
jgi:hypothetical protein